MKRRERTRHLIELGGLVRKSGLIDLTDDDRAVLYGAFLEIASMLRGENREQNLTLWRRRGSEAFKCETTRHPSYQSRKRSATVVVKTIGKNVCGPTPAAVWVGQNQQLLFE